jgi:hypothetical protein
MPGRTSCKLFLPIAGLSSPLAVAAGAALVAGGFAAGYPPVLLVFPPVIAAAFLVLALVAALLGSLAELDVAIGNDGLRLRWLFGRTKVLRFARLTDLRVDGDRVLLVEGGRKRRLYLRPGTLLRGLRDALAALVRLQKYKAGMVREERRLSRYDRAVEEGYIARVSLEAAWEEYRARQGEAAALETRLRVDPAEAEGYRIGAIGDDELARAILEPGVGAKVRVDAARALIRADPARAVRVVADAAESTCDDDLERELGALRRGGAATPAR